MRLYGLKALEMASCGLAHTLAASAARLALVRILINLTAGAETWKERNLAIRMLAATVPIMMAPDFPSRIRKLAFDTTSSRFMSFFPPDFASRPGENNTPFYDIRTYVSPQDFQSRIAALAALSRFFRTPEAQAPQFIKFIDETFTAILTTNAHQLLAAAAIRAIATELPITNRNRLRVELFFRDPITRLTLGDESSNNDAVAESATSSGLPLRKSSKSSNKIHSGAQAKVPVSLIPGGPGLHPHLARQISNFWSTWHPRVSDEELMCIDESNDEPTPHINPTGYAGRRRAMLMPASPVSKDNRLALNESIADENKIAAIAALKLRPYTPDSIPPMATNFFNKLAPPLPPALSSIDPNDINSIILPEIPVKLPQQSLLTFNLKPPVLQFGAAPFHIDVFLENISLQHETPFCIQAYPHHYFSVAPSFGIIQRGESVSIRVSFRPKPYMYRKSAEIHGFLRVRTSEGFPVERISLLAYNTPSVKIMPTVLDFGHCPKGSTRVAAVTLQNLMPVDCPVVMVINPSMVSGVFHISNTQVMLAPRERKTITVKCSQTDSDGPVEDELIIISYGSDMMRLPLQCICSQSLRIIDNKLDFGPTDIYFASVKKKLHLLNMDAKRSLPVSFLASTRELTINRGEHVVLKPKEQRSIPIEFLSSIGGVRQETLSVMAPGAAPTSIEVNAFSGPMMLMPVLDDIYLPPTPINTPVSVKIPITNTTGANVRLIVYVAADYPVQIRPLETDYANRRINTPNVVIETKPHQTQDQDGLLITLSSKMTIVIEVEVETMVAGMFTIPLITQMIKPKAMDVASQNIHICVLSDTVLSTSKVFQTARQFARAPFMQKATDPSVFKVDDGDAANSASKPPSNIASDIFNISPTSQTVFGSTSLSRPRDTLEFVSLTNMTSEKQRYHLVLSLHFITDIPLEGEIPAHASLCIPIRIDPKLYTTNESRHFAAHGYIAVHDTNYNQPGFVATQLTGIIGDLIWFELRDDVMPIRFPNTRAMEAFTRKLVIRNKSGIDLIWEGSLAAINTSGPTLTGRRGSQAVINAASGNHPDEWLPFAISANKLNLKPFEYCVLDITFMSNHPGDFKCKLSMSYVDPIEHVQDAIAAQTQPAANGGGLGQAIRPRQKRMLGPWILECSVGHPEVSHVPEFIHFGDTPLTESVERPLALLNNSVLEAEIALASLISARSNHQRFRIPPKTRFDLTFTFAPPKNAIYAEHVAFTVGGVLHSIPILGYGGVFGLDSNLAKPFHIHPQKDNKELRECPAIDTSTIDFGFVNTLVPKTRVFLIKNTGSLDINVVSLVSLDERHVSWETLEEEEDVCGRRESDPVFGKEAPDALETDWDEMDWVAEQAKVLRAGGSPAQAVVAQQKQTQQGKGRRGGGKQGAMRGIFPLRIPPFQSVRLSLKFSGTDKGEFTCPLRLDIEKTREETQCYVWWVKGSLQPPLNLWEKKIDFGICAVHKQHKSQIQFTNTGTQVLSWRLEYAITRYTPIAKYEPPPLPRDKRAIPNAIAIYPDHGKLKPGTTQSVDVVFTPNLAQYDILATYKLLSEDYAESPIFIRGTGASSRLTVDNTKLDFGILRVGTQKVFSLKLRNRGILPLKFFVESTHTQFHADPEQGELAADGKSELVVKFQPRAVGKIRAMLNITSVSKEGHRKSPVQIVLTGMGSYPELVVLTKVVDFGTALFKNPNKRIIKAQNKGSAEAHVVFSCFHPDITLEMGGHGEVVIAPHEIRDLVLVYTPQIVERLDAKAFMRSSDTRGDNFMIMLKGNVGIPRLNIMPADALDTLDFGVMRLNKAYKKTFKISNDGNIFLNFKVELALLFQKEIQIEVDLDHLSQRRVKNAPTPVTVEPQSGTLGVGEDIVITVTFTPTMIYEYEYQITLTYDFQSFSGVVRGIGGRASLKLDSPLKAVDFGMSRINRTYVKIVSLSNRGNLGLKYHVRPEPSDTTWDVYDSEIAHLAILESASRPQTGAVAKLPTLQDDDGTEEVFWERYLSEVGIRLHNPDGLCPAHSKMNLIVEFQPKVANPIVKPMRIYFGDNFETFDVTGNAASPNLFIRDTSTGQIIVPGLPTQPTVNIGVHPVNSVHTHLFELVNDGVFGVDFLMQPMSNSEFDVHPLRGFVEAGSSFTFKVFFQPNTENQFHTTLKLLWEGKSLAAHVVGNGGLGRLEVVYMDDKEILLKGLDFGMVPFNSACEKRFHLLNTGLVGVAAVIEVENDEYSITQFGDSFVVADVKKPRPSPKGLIVSWYNSIKVVLPPGRAFEFGIRFLARSATTSVGNITIRSECGNLMIPLKGKGGTISLSHRNDLDFGDISCNYTYTRKITIVNGGSIPSQLQAEWLVVGHSSEHASSLVKLAENFTPLDPRSGWARNQYLREKNAADLKRQFTAKEYWALIALMVKKSSVKETDVGRGSGANSRMSVNGLAPGSGLHAPGGHSTLNMLGGVGGRLGGAMHSFSIVHAAKRTTPVFSTHFKRRQMFYHLITSTQLTSQSTSRVRPYVKVDPPTLLLPSYGEAAFNVELHLASEDTFLATLVVRSEIPNTPVHEISLTATPKIVNIVCDDTRMLNFYRQPLGETEFITRTFTNVGHKDIAYRFINANAGLTIVPSAGSLKVGQTVVVTFAFKPVDESIQNSDVIFEPNCSQPVRFRMYGGGGYAKASLSKYRRFDFGHCMIGKDTISFLPVTNEGSAILHLTRFEIVETDTFFRGKDWPESRVSLFPGKAYNLPLVFNPHDENPPPGRLIVGTNTETYEIELIGLGREAVLIVSKVALEFSECIIGNSYEQRLGLKNIGDVNYPVTFQLEKEFADLEFYPPSLLIDPFSESFVTIAYTPSHETKVTVVFSVSSPYSTHKVPVMLHAGVAILEFNSTELHYGMFERTTRPSITLSVKNTGTVRTAFHIKDTNRPSMFQLSPTHGVLTPGKTIDVSITHIRHEVAEFEERLVVRTDLIDKLYHIKVHGQCEETVLHPEEFSLVNMGVCPVLEQTSRPLMFRNHGKFPLEYSIKAAYPLKVFPTQGQVLGEESGTVNIQWNPSGGYELRTQVQMVTNIGKFQIVVRGKAMFPEIHVNNMYIDFGICAVGFSYREAFQIENKGKVPVHFAIPPPKDASYTTSIHQGVMAPKETLTVDVIFTPATMGKLTSSIMVECKGIHYKEIVVAGLGGQMRMDIRPKSIALGRCPFGLRIYETVAIANGGDVTLYVDFSQTEAKQNDLIIMVPDPIVIAPHRVAKCIIGFSTEAVGHFTAKLLLFTKEQTFSIPVTGIGVKIVLTERSKYVLENEQLVCLRDIDPFHVEPKLNFLGCCVRRLHKAFQMDLTISQTISQLYYLHRKMGRAMSDSSFQLDVDDLQFNAVSATSGRSSVLSESFAEYRNILPMSEVPELVPEEDQATNTIHAIDMDVFFADISSPVHDSNQSLPSNPAPDPSSLPQEDTPRVSDEAVAFETSETSPVASDSQEAMALSLDQTPIMPDQAILISPSNTDAHTEEVDTAPLAETVDPLQVSIQSNTTSLTQSTPPARESTVAEPELNIADSDPFDEAEIGRIMQVNGDASIPNPETNTTHTIDDAELMEQSMSASSTDTQQQQAIEVAAAAEPTSVGIASTVTAGDLDFSTQAIQKREQIIAKLDELNQPTIEIQTEAIDSVFEEFIDIKNREYEPEMVPDDHIINEVIIQGKLQVLELDIDAILIEQEPDVFIDLSPLTDRPLPFRRDDNVKPGSSTKNMKAYTTVAPSLQRKIRNATTNPFAGWKDPMVPYGRGVQLYPPMRG